MSNQQAGLIQSTLSIVDRNQSSLAVGCNKQAANLS